MSATGERHRFEAETAATKHRTGAIYCAVRDELVETLFDFSEESFDERNTSEINQRFPRSAPFEAYSFIGTIDKPESSQAPTVTQQLLLAFAMFAFVTSITPGPNNMMLLASGVNVGFKASLPLIAGIASGFFVLLTAVGLGLSQLFTYLPASFTLLKMIGAAYLLYLAWLLFNSSPPAEEAERSRQPPLSFWPAAAFQWVNPKAWIMATSAFSTYAPPSPSYGQVMTLASVFCAIGLPCICMWAAAGTQLRNALKKPTTLRLFNGCMAGLLVLSLYPLLSR